MAKRKTAKKKAAPRARMNPQLKEAKADFVEAKKREAACKRAVAAAQKDCVDEHPNAVASGAKYRAAVSAHVKSIRQRLAAAARVSRLM